MHKRIPKDEMCPVFHGEAIYKSGYKMVKILGLIFQ